MRISPIDIQQQQFKSRPFGYEKAGVDRFLEMLAEELERLIRQNQDLEEELARTRASLAEMRDRETTLKETLLTTQRVTDELKATARREVEVMMADAELRAERLMRNAEERRIQLIGEIQEIKRQKIDFETTLRSLLEKHIRMLDLNVVSIEGETEETRLLEEPLPFEKRERQAAATEAAPETEPAEEVRAAKPSGVTTAAAGAGPSDTTDRDLEFDLPFDFNGNHADADEEPLK